MPDLIRIRSVVALLLTAGLTSVVVGQAEKPERPKEAAVESIAADIDSSLRSAIADKLQDEIDAVQEKLTAQRTSLKQLREQLREREKQVRELDLKIQFLQDRLDQWTPEPQANQANQAERDEPDEDRAKESKDKANSEDKQDEVKP